MPDATQPEEKLNLANSQEIAKIAKQDFVNSSYWRIFLTAVLLLLLFGSTTLIAFLTNKIRGAEPINFEECAKIKSSVIQESYPAVCVTKDGLNFIQEIPEDEKSLEFELENSIDTSDWKIYINEPLGFNLKYPLDWEIFNRLDQENPFLQIIKPGPTNSQFDWTDGATFILSFENIGDNSDEQMVLHNPETKVFDYSGWSGYRLQKDTDNSHDETIIISKTSPNNVTFKINWSQLNPSDNKLSAELYLIPMLSTFEFLDENVQGVSTQASCLQTEQKMLEEISECEEISEAKCLVLKEQFDECLSSCQEDLGETECFEICKPVCNTAILE